ncbi:MAG: hypothetical protein IPF83_05240 [Rhodanobacteraceae bacterium]|nr:hypothetical protein [Rhodanobacteraceae bacterium]
MSATRSTRNLVLAGLSAVFFAACSSSSQQQAQRGGSPVTVRSTVIVASDWQDSVQALGTAKANESLTITAKVSETVQKVAFDSGDFVEAGQVLVDSPGRCSSPGWKRRAALRKPPSNN